MTRLSTAAFAALGGAGVGVLALLTHRLGGNTLPWGLVLAAAASVSISWALTVLRAGPTAVVAYGLGWGAAVVVALGGRPEGDYLVAADTLGWGLLIGVTTAVFVVTVLGVSTGRSEAASRQSIRSDGSATSRRPART